MSKDHLQQTGLIDLVQIVDIMTPEGQQMAGSVLPPGTSGVPIWKSMTSGKHVVGFKPIEQLIESLR